MNMSINTGAATPINGQTTALFPEGPEIKPIPGVLPDNQPDVNPPTPDADDARSNDERKRKPRDRSGDGNPFPIHAFPNVVRNLGEEFYRVYNALPETVCLPCLVTMGGALGTGIHAYDGNRKTLPNLFAYLDLKTAGYKSSAFDEAQEPLNEYNIRRRTLHDEKVKELRGTISAAKVKLESVKRRIKDGKGALDAWSAMRAMLKAVSEGDKTREALIKRSRSKAGQLDPDPAPQIIELLTKACEMDWLISLGESNGDEAFQLSDNWQYKLPAVRTNEMELSELEQTISEAMGGMKFWNIRSSDSTVEALAKKGSDLGKLFIATDEASIVQSILVGRYSSEFTNEGFYCKLYSGGGYERERIDEKENSCTDAIYGCMLLMGQPHITKKIYDDANMQVSGFTPRFLFANIPADLEESDTVEPLSQDVRDKYKDAVVQMFEQYWDVPLKKSQRIEMTPAALRYFRDFQNECIRNYAGRFDDIDGLVARTREQAIKIAIVLHVAKANDKDVASDTDNPKKPITEATAKDAAQIVLWSLRNYLAYNLAAHDESEDMIETHALNTVRNSKDPVDARYVYRKNRQHIDNTKHADKVLDSLLRKGKIEIFEQDGVANRNRKPLFRATSKV